MADNNSCSILRKEIRSDSNCNSYPYRTYFIPFYALSYILVFRIKCQREIMTVWIYFELRSLRQVLKYISVAIQYSVLKQRNLFNAIYYDLVFFFWVRSRTGATLKLWSYLISLNKFWIDGAINRWVQIKRVVWEDSAQFC